MDVTWIIYYNVEGCQTQRIAELRLGFIFKYCLLVCSKCEIKSVFLSDVVYVPFNMLDGVKTLSAGKTLSNQTLLVLYGIISPMKSKFKLYMLHYEIAQLAKKVFCICKSLVVNILWGTSK